MQRKTTLVIIETKNENKIDSYILFVKDSIDLRVESLKAELDAIRETLFNRLDTHKIQALK